MLLRSRSARGSKSSASALPLEQLFNEHVDAVFGFVLNRTGVRDVSEEVVAETFAEAARVLARDPSLVLERAWFFDVARKRLIDVWRREALHARRIEKLREFGEQPEIAPQIEKSVVVESLEELPSRQRAAMVLHYLDGYRVSEIADLLGISYQAVESLLARGRRSLLAAYLERNGHE